MNCSLSKYTGNPDHHKYTLNDFEVIQQVVGSIKWKNPPHYTQFHVDTICHHQYLDETFMETFQDHLDWEVVSWHQQLSEGFIEKYSYQLDWKNISLCQNISEEFIDKQGEILSGIIKRLEYGNIIVDYADEPRIDDDLFWKDMNGIIPTRK